MSLFRSRLAAAVFSAVCLLQWSAAYAADLPQVSEVVAGQVSFAQPDASTLDVTASDRSIINYSQFNIGQGNTVNFIQPSAEALVLNRVTGVDASTIAGNLNANGRVFLINPNGVLFTGTSRVDASGLVASTMGMSNEDFLAGRFHFAGPGAGSITNNGQIQIRNGGYLALLSPSIRNNGSIEATLGSVVLAGGEAATLNLDDAGDVSVLLDPATVPASIANNGQILAEGGKVVLTASSLNQVLDAAVNNNGLIRANTIQEKEGSIELLSSGTAVNNGTIEAKASELDGKGGQVILKGQSATIESGSIIDVSGGLNSGNAGFVEVSGDSVGLYGQVIGDAAPGFLRAALLIDPLNIVIANKDLVTPTTQFFDVATLKAMLVGEIILQATQDITLLSNLTGLNSALKLEASRHILINALLETNGKAVTMHADFDHNGVGNLVMAPGKSIITNGGNVSLSAYNLILTTIDALSGHLDITAGGSIADDNNNSTFLKAAAIDLTAADLIGGQGNRMDTETKSLSFDASSVYINNRSADGVTVNGQAQNLADVYTQGDMIVGGVSAGNELTLWASGAIENDTDETNVLESNRINLVAGSIGTQLNRIDTRSSELNMIAAGHIFAEEVDGGAFFASTVLGSADILAHGTSTLKWSSIADDYAFKTTSGDILLDSLVDAGGSIHITADNGNINGLSDGLHLKAGDISYLETPKGTMGLTKPVDVDINAPLILNLGANVDFMAGVLTGKVNNPTAGNIPIFSPVSYPMPLYPPGRVYFNSVKIWPPESQNDNILMLSQQAGSLLNKFIFPHYERLVLTQINVIDLTSSFLTGPVFYYHPLTEIDNGAEGFQLEQGAYDFIDGQLSQCSDVDPVTRKCRTTR